MTYIYAQQFDFQAKKLTCQKGCTWIHEMPWLSPRRIADKKAMVVPSQDLRSITENSLIL